MGNNVSVNTHMQTAQVFHEYDCRISSSEVSLVSSRPKATYISERRLGSGAFGTVYAVRRESDPDTLWAFKQVLFDPNEPGDAVTKMTDVLDEAAALRGIRDPNLIHLEHAYKAKARRTAKRKIATRIKDETGTCHLLLEIMLTTNPANRRPAADLLNCGFVAGLRHALASDLAQPAFTTLAVSADWQYRGAFLAPLADPNLNDHIRGKIVDVVFQSVGLGNTSTTQLSSASVPLIHQGIVSLIYTHLNHNARKDTTTESIINQFAAALLGQSVEPSASVHTVPHTDVPGVVTGAVLAGPSDEPDLISALMALFGGRDAKATVKIMKKELAILVKLLDDKRSAFLTADAIIACPGMIPLLLSHVRRSIWLEDSLTFETCAVLRAVYRLRPNTSSVYPISSLLAALAAPNGRSAYNRTFRLMYESLPKTVNSCPQLIARYAAMCDEKPLRNRLDRILRYAQSSGISFPPELAQVWGHVLAQRALTALHIGVQPDAANHINISQAANAAALASLADAPAKSLAVAGNFWLHAYALGLDRAAVNDAIASLSNMQLCTQMMSVALGASIPLVRCQTCSCAAKQGIDVCIACARNCHAGHEFADSFHVIRTVVTQTYFPCECSTIAGSSCKSRSANSARPIAALDSIAPPESLLAAPHQIIGAVSAAVAPPEFNAWIEPVIDHDPVGHTSTATFKLYDLEQDAATRYRNMTLPAGSLEPYISRDVAKLFLSVSPRLYAIAQSHGFAFSPITTSPNPIDVVFYYEIEVCTAKLIGDSDYAVGMGLMSAVRNPSSALFVGWGESEWGYHSDDGGLRHATPTGGSTIMPWSAGDRVGCGIHASGRVFFTLNGVYIDSLPQVPPDVPLYATVTVQNLVGDVVFFFDRGDWAFDPTRWVVSPEMASATWAPSCLPLASAGLTALITAFCLNMSLDTFVGIFDAIGRSVIATDARIKHARALAAIDNSATDSSSSQPSLGDVAAAAQSGHAFVRIVWILQKSNDPEAARRAAAIIALPSFADVLAATASISSPLLVSGLEAFVADLDRPDLDLEP
ncbi:uncharacterized protein AMSG_05928 [Thecamonas trahens ATCC 50062]|uniref:B30.2/SPRY domain-containing protein n=1 Tax=Thecamonas trahens ATCC 50062 TaxID=461836 RepID=A0A0L0DBF6_THETB|nr:hypothetical protein AMSG_05928 [Thecamonas trahens ATCC 50062]KNC49667.1 hypothetical protein AMSG_05928 [Thecamonas trahens ATCC 50062]|eukprot:XP_013757465.1 hypothetical protein AMSG_05928 [Thecamonas trahens ATCC 50062]